MFEMESRDAIENIKSMIEQSEGIQQNINFEGKYLILNILFNLLI